MYCVNCGVKLSDTEKRCPLCQTAVYHPELPRKEAEPLYPEGLGPEIQVNPLLMQFIVTACYLLAMAVCLVCDLQLGDGIVWAGYVIGGLLLSYVVIILPLWFKNPNPVIFVPCDFVAAGLYLLYINLATGGKWFLSFAFPVAGFVGLVVTAVVVLRRYIRRGRLYVFGGAILAMGGFMPLMEFLLTITFPIPFIGWYLYPLIALGLAGGMLLFLAICKPARHAMAQKFFI
ncbi:MAG: hypothetical protein E7447_02455 [Ruminococcaceae bacterium]|nr:hypothetical protein [Oscillospiraceae bacterium]